MDKIIASFKRASPTFLTIAGAIGVIGTAVLAVKETPKAMKLCEGLRLKRVNEYKEEPTKLDYVKAAWRCYIPAASVGAATILCILTANGLNRRQQRSLTSAYMLIDAAYKEYRKKVTELYGQEADDKIQAAIAKDRCETSPHSDDPNALLFFDFFSGRYLERTMEEVIDAEYQLNRKMAMNDSVTLNEFYELLGIEAVDFGDALGWSFGASESYYGYQWIDFIHELQTMDDGLECYVIHMAYPPTADFMDYC